MTSKNILLALMVGLVSVPTLFAGQMAFEALQAVANNPELRRVANEIAHDVRQGVDNMRETQRANAERERRRLQDQIDELEEKAADRSLPQWQQQAAQRELDDMRRRQRSAEEHHAQMQRQMDGLGADLVKNTLEGAQKEVFATFEHMRTRETALAEAQIKASNDRKAQIQKLKMWLDTVKKNPAGVVGLTFGVSLALAGGYYIVKNGAELMVDAYKKPALADDDKTSMKFGLINTIKSWIYGAPDVESSLSDVILKPELADRINSFVGGLENTVKNGGYLKNILLWGQPGTGKTMLAMRMARSSGLHYIYFSGSSVAMFSLEEATRVVTQLFRFAATADKPVMIIIDEAERLLGDRTNPSMDDKTKSLVNLILQYTGTESRDIIVCALTNHPSQLDEAYLSRCDDRIQISAPESTERRAILELYIDKILRKASNLKPRKASPFSLKYWFGSEEEVSAPVLAPDVLTDDYITHINDRIKGFVGRDISKMIIDVQVSAFAREDKMITRELIDRIVSVKIREKEEELAGFVRDTVSLKSAGSGA